MSKDLFEIIKKSIELAISRAKVSPNFSKIQLEIDMEPRFTLDDKNPIEYEVSKITFSFEQQRKRKENG